MIKLKSNLFVNLFLKLAKKNAITIYPFIFVRKKTITVELIAHELVHIQQFRRYGFFKFVFLYFIEFIKRGYWGNNYEIQARIESSKYNQSAVELIYVFQKR